MVYIFSSVITARLEYSFCLIFETILGDSAEFISDEKIFLEKKGVKINYSDNEKLDGFLLRPTHLLFETGLQSQEPEVFEWEELKVFYRVENSFLPFDIFAATFYLVTRYEEYFPGKRDRHHRYLSRSSFANVNRFLEKPLINYWALKMAGIIEYKNEGYHFAKSSFSYIPTIDIDNAWAYKNKGIPRAFFSTFKDILKGRWSQIKERFSVLFKSEKDPYDNYEFLHDIFHRFNLRPIFFILLNKKGKHDRSLSHKNRNYRRLILSLSKWGDVGIHPSYASDKRKKELGKEISRLESILGREVKLSRQHFLKITMPKTYRRLIENGIEADFSMGFASRPGFRASICTPYFFFDLIENKQTALKIFPFQVMDVTLLNYRNLNAEEALKKINVLMKETAAVGGTFISLWHNESLGDEGIWEGWRDVYTEMTRLAVELSK
jgi:hypothetical protein